jgi:formylglycine-generating enzyme required for sulfatase activity
LTTSNASEIKQNSSASTPCRQPEDPPFYSRHGDADLPVFNLLPLIQSGNWRITLPSELEWEKAARGGLVNMIFPWGDTPNLNRANYADSNLVNTSAVGCFPPNVYGLYDMVGNVWEWTRSLWGFDYPYSLDDFRREDLKAGDDNSRVVRGGSWDNSQGRARCAVRFRSEPDLRYYFSLGFRVVLCPAPDS